MFDGKKSTNEGYLPLTTQDIKATSLPPVERRQLLRVARSTVSQATLGRHKDKFVALPSTTGEGNEGDQIDVKEQTQEGTSSAQLAPSQGRIAVYCTSERYNREQLEEVLRARQSRWLLQQHPDVLYGQYWKPGLPEPKGHIFYFDYGVVAFWGLTTVEEQDVLKNVLPSVEVDRLGNEVELDTFKFVYSFTEQPNIQNDIITINYRPTMHMSKLAICLALSQSIKLNVHEHRVQALVESTKHLPTQLTQTGHCSLSRKQVAQLIGEVFLQHNQISLLSTVVDTPEFFWTAPDALQLLYQHAHEYLEVDVRVQALKNRLEVLQDLLDLLRDHQNAHHATKLEWVVIWLIVIECVVGALEVAGLFGWIGVHH